MTGTVRRVVDAHVHHWDPANVEWYPFLATDDALKALGMADVSRMRRYFDQAIYLDEAKAWNVEKYVHVTATAGGDHFLAETDRMAELAAATGHPDAIIGSVDPHLGPAGIVAQLDRQREAAQFRGIRVTEGMDHGSAAARTVLDALAERDLVYDVIVHPADMLATARALAGHDTLTAVVEHTGWPLSEEESHVRQWRAGMAALADLGPRVHCKFSGLVMTLNRIDAAAFRPWFDHCLEVFGPDRCFFASNFPVDGLFGTFDDLYGAYDRLTADLDPTVRDQLFAANAERLYRC